MKPNDDTGWQWVDVKIKEKRNQKYTEVSRSGFYSSKAWIDVRNIKLANSPLCEYCLSIADTYTTAVMVDHIEPIQSEHDVKALEYSNLQSLCDYHHRRKTRLDNSKYNPKNLQKGKDTQEYLSDW